MDENTVMDPEEVFGGLFGGERFHDIIGTVSLGREMKEALQKDSSELQAEAEGQADSKAETKLTPEQEAAKELEAQQLAKEKEAQREERVSELADKLAHKLSIYAESVRTSNGDAQVDEARAGFREIVRLEAEELKQEKYAAYTNRSFGVDLLHAVGFVYTAKSRHYLASHGMFGSLGGFFHAASSSIHTVRETVSTLHAALELKKVFEELAKAEDEGITEERKKQLEDKAAEKGYVARLTPVSAPSLRAPSSKSRASCAMCAIACCTMSRCPSLSSACARKPWALSAMCTHTPWPMKRRPPRQPLLS